MTEEKFVEKFVAATRVYQSALCCSAEMLDGHTVEWLSLIRRCVDALSTDGQKLLASSVWGPDNSSPENLIALCRSWALTLIMRYPKPCEALEELTRFAEKLPNHLSRGRYEVTFDWFTSRAQIWDKVLAPLANVSGLQVLEVGSFEGLATCWLLDHILTHSSSHIKCIDLFPPAARRRFARNIALSGSDHKVEMLVGRSEDILPTMKDQSFDLIYIDGSHCEVDVWKDAQLSWPLLKMGGIIVFDDYEIGKYFMSKYYLNEYPDIAIDLFLRAHRTDLRVLHSGYQLIAEKMSRAGPSK